MIRRGPFYALWSTWIVRGVAASPQAGSETVRLRDWPAPKRPRAGIETLRRGGHLTGATLTVVSGLSTTWSSLRHPRVARLRSPRAGVS